MKDVYLYWSLFNTYLGAHHTYHRGIIIIIETRNLGFNHLIHMVIEAFGACVTPKVYNATD